MTLTTRINHAMYKTKSFIAYSIEEKLEIIKNPRKLYNEMKELGKNEGIPFMCYAIAIEATEDILVPAILTATGHPEYIPLALAVHTEPVLYPLWFGVRKYLQREEARHMS